MNDVTFKDILLHSPYERLLDYGLTESEFREYLLVRNEEYKKIANEIFASFSQGDKSKTFYFLKGFSGCGKTTFIRWLIKEIIDTKETTFNSGSLKIYREYINLSFTSNSEKRYFEKTIIDIIDRKFEDYKSTFIFIERNHDKIFPHLNGIKNKSHLIADITTESKSSSLFKSAFDSLLDDLPVKTLLTICLLQKIIHVEEKKHDLCFFCIDNLDSFDYSYLLEDFWQDFFYAYNKLIDIRKEFDWSFDIKKKLKVLYVLREHNYNLVKANFNKHASDVLRPLTHDAFSIIQPDVKKILENRVNYALNREIDINSDILKLINLILDEDDIFREKFYLPLFNYDLRKLNQKIVEIATNENLLHFKFDFKKYGNLFKHRDPQFKNGARGIILHGFLKTLFNSEEKYPIDPIFDDDYLEDSSSQPFCSYCRLLITVIYNLTCQDDKRLNKKLDNLALITKEQFPLSKLISSLRIFNDTKEPIIPYKSIFYWLSKFYNLRNETVTHLINISEKTTNTSRDISFDEELIESLQNQDFATNSIINNINIRINPSGVIYLRYLIPHFEFLAAYKYWREDKDEFSKLFKPLYLSTDYSTLNNKYEFETLIDDVYSIVEKKKRGNDKFLEERIFKYSKVNNIGKYLDSKFVLHLKDINSQLYSSRTITTHLRYLEYFRKYLIEDEAFGNYVNQMKNLYGSNVKSLKEIEKFILKYQKKYIDLYFNNEKHESFDYTISEIMKKWKKHIYDLSEGRVSYWISDDN
jgi:ABC-type oligopeptide transport system ATPase subunit